MYVKDHMTKNPVTILPDTSVSKALELMQQGKFHRIPVTDENGRLVGLITEGVVTESSGSNQTSLSIYELNYLLSRTKVKEIMIKDVVSIDPDSFVEQAAEKMLQHEINVLPVVDNDNKVIGIITEKDIFQTFVDLLGLQHQGTRFVFHMEDKPGSLVKAMQLLAVNDANVEAAGVYRTSERGTETFVKATGEISVEKMTKIFKENDIHVVNIIQTTKDGMTVSYNPEDLN
jgi:acetoin utilization protein AcuB